MTIKPCLRCRANSSVDVRVTVTQDTFVFNRLYEKGQTLEASICTSCLCEFKLPPISFLRGAELAGALAVAHIHLHDSSTAASSQDERCAYADGYAEGREEVASLATQLEQMRRERDEARSDRDAMAQALGETRVDLAEARATNARLHRRAQGVDARKPEDELLIRRLRADVRGQAKHAGHVIGYVMRLRCALSDAQHAVFMALRERDEARAKLARVRALAVPRYDTQAAAYALTHVLRIIDDKEPPCSKRGPCPVHLQHCRGLPCPHPEPCRS